MTPLPLELAVFSSSDALRAQALGASRIELNHPGSYPAGGLTPPPASVAALSPQLRIPLRVMIRPRGAPLPAPAAAKGLDSDGVGGGGDDGAASLPDFIYSPAELQLMRAAVIEIKASRAMDASRGDGFVFGVLQWRRDTNSNNNNGGGGGSKAGGKQLVIDAENCKELVRLAHPIPCVFHRAFDLVVAGDGDDDDDDGEDDEAAAATAAALDTLVECGFVGVLTAGGAVGTYVDNLARLRRICRLGKARRIQVIAGGGVRHHNVAGPGAGFAALAGEGGDEQEKEAPVWLHSAALREDGSGVDENEVRKLLEQLGS